MKEIKISSQTGKTLCLVNLKNSIIIMFIIMGIFIGNAIACVFAENWTFLINSILFSLCDLTCILWMREYQKVFKFFKEQYDEITITKSSKN